MPYVGFYKMLAPAVVLRDPELVADVMIRHWNSFQGNDFPVHPRFDPLPAVNPFFNIGDAWKRGRNILVPIFTASKVFMIVFFSVENGIKSICVVGQEHLSRDELRVR